MSILFITTEGYSEGSPFGIDPNLFIVDKYLEHTTKDCDIAVTVQYADEDGRYVQVYADLSWSEVRREIMDIASLFTAEPIAIVVVFGAVTNVQYGPLNVEDGWFELDDDEDDDE